MHAWGWRETYPISMGIQAVRDLTEEHTVGSGSPPTSLILRQPDRLRRQNFVKHCVVPECQLTAAPHFAFVLESLGLRVGRLVVR